MTFLLGLKDFGKFLKDGWRTVIWGERAETWDEKLYSLLRRGWSNVYTYLGPQEIPYILTIIDYTLILCVGYWISLAIIELGLRINDETADQSSEKVISENSGIVSDGANEDVVNSAEKTPACSDLESTASAGDNDPDIQRESSVSSDTTIVTSERNEEKNFLKNFIASIAPGDDGDDREAVEKNSKEKMNEQDIPELQESTRQKVDSKNCKHFYMLTPWMGDSVEAGDTDGSCVPTNYSLSAEPMIEEQKKADSAMRKNFISRPAEQNEINKNSFVPSKLSEPNSPEAATVDVINDERKSTEQTMRETTDSTLADPRETSSVCCADEVLSSVTDCGKNIFSPQNPSAETEKLCKTPDVPETVAQRDNNTERVFDNFPTRLPELDLSPISHHPEKIEKTVDIAASEIRTDSKHRFRSLSHDSRTASCLGYSDDRRGSSVSPPTRNKIKQRTINQKPSKIPTLSPLTHRAMQQHQEIDGSLAETANRIRSVLLRKLKEVWEQRILDKTPSMDSSKNSSFETSIYSTPEAGSRIPLPRRSPHHSKANYLTPSARLISHSDRSTDQSGQSGTIYSVMMSERICQENIDVVPLHSTPKTSPLSRGNNQ